MEFAPLIAKPFLPRAESAEVLSRLGHNIAVKLEDDSSRWACAGQVVRFGLNRLEQTSAGNGLTIIHSQIKVDL